MLQNAKKCCKILFGGFLADALEDVENMVLSFSLAEQIRLLNFVADNIKKTSILSKGLSEADSLQKMRDSSFATVWESVKNDTW